VREHIHFSQLKEARNSAAHLLAALTNKDRKDTPAMLMGRVIHSAYLEGVAPVVYDGERRGKAWQEFREAQEGDIITATEYETVQRILDALGRSREASDVLAQSTGREVAWTGEIMGVQAAGKIDLLGPGCVDELKTCAVASPRKFLYDADRMWYDAQLAWYQMSQGVQYIGPDTEWKMSRIIAAENKAPFVVQVYQLDPLRLDQGAKKICRALDLLRESEASGVWSGYAAGVQIWDGDIIVSDEEEEEA
jgi:hypothetical protein